MGCGCQGSTPQRLPAGGRTAEPGEVKRSLVSQEAMVYRPAARKAAPNKPAPKR